MEKQEGKKKIPFQEKMRDYAFAHGHYPPPTKADHLREIELLQKQALKRNGVFHKSIFASRSYFTFDYNGVKLKVGSKLTEVQDEEFRHDTYVKAFTKLNDNLKVHIYFKGIRFFEKIDIGLKKIETGNNDFDKKFTIKGNDESLIFSLLKTEIQNELIKLEEDYFYPVLSINKKELQLTAQNRLYEEKEYDALINTALKFLDNLRALGLLQYSNHIL